MRDFRPILNILGLLLCIESIALLIPMIFDYINNNEDWKQFFFISCLTFFIGLVLYVGFKNEKLKINLRQAFLLTILSWLVIALFGSLPFMYSSSSLNFTNAFFESVSGITTTGSTVISNFDSLSEGILIWRSLLQWFGGIGIIVLAVAILPTLQIGGMQLLHMEHDDPYEKTLPKINKFIFEIIFLYFGLTILCLFSYYFNGMNAFDSLIHSMTTISTGGFSNKSLSFGYFDSQTLESISILFMILGSLPFTVTIAVPAKIDVHNALMRYYRDEGFEVALLIDLPEGSNATEVTEILDKAISTVSEATTILERTPGTLQNSREISTALADRLALSGHGLVLYDTGVNPALERAKSVAVPVKTIYRNLDQDNGNERAMRRFLDGAAFRAQQEGSVIITASPSPSVISALTFWSLQERSSSVIKTSLSQALLASFP